MDETRAANEERFKTIFRRLGEGENRMDKHGDLIAENSKTIAIVDTRLLSVVEALEKTTNTMKWMMGMIAVELLGFFFYAVKAGLFK